MATGFSVTNYRALDDAVAPAVTHVADRIASDARSNTPRRTGTLAAGWKVRKGARGRSEVYNDVPYARFVEYGTSDTPAAAMLGKATAAARASYGK